MSSHCRLGCQWINESVFRVSYNCYVHSCVLKYTVAAARFFIVLTSNYLCKIFFMEISGQWSVEDTEEINNDNKKEEKLTLTQLGSRQ